MPPRRSPPPSGSEAGRASVEFSFDGRRFEGIEGEPVAVSLLAAGRRTLSRSFRFHRPRGLMCSTGQCGWCECEVDGRPSVRTCRVPLRAGMVVRGEHAWPSVERDLLRALDLGSRFVPPTFYHHRFLRPRRLRKAYLDVIRSFGGRGRLGGDPSSRGRVARVVRRDAPDVLVVGGGRAGLLASIGAAEVHARVVVLEAERQDADGPAAVLMAEAAALGVDVRTGSTAAGWYDGMVTAIDDEAIWELRPQAVVAATGSYELVPTVPGSDRPGVMSARLAARVLARHAVLPGDRALLVGAGEELVGVGAALRRAGADTLGPVPTAELRAIGGRGSVAWVRFVDAAPGAVVRREPVEIVVFGDRTPNLDLVLAAGGRVEWRGGRLAPVAGLDGGTSVAGLFVAGDATGEPVDAIDGDAGARAVGRAAGLFARDAAGGKGSVRGARTISAPPARTETPDEATHPRSTRAGDPPRSATDGRPPEPGSPQAVLCFCEDVRGWEVTAERGAGYADPELVKRRTGALTGPCQGKYCLSAVTGAMGVPDADPGSDPGDPNPYGLLLPTGRPPLRPLRLLDLVAEEGPSADVPPGPAGAVHRAPEDPRPR